LAFEWNAAESRFIVSPVEPIVTHIMTLGVSRCQGVQSVSQTAKDDKIPSACEKTLGFQSECDQILRRLWRLSPPPKGAALHRYVKHSCERDLTAIRTKALAFFSACLRGHDQGQGVGTKSFPLDRSGISKRLRMQTLK